MRPPLKEHQAEDVDWIQLVLRGLLANEPGLGKSRSALEATKGAGRIGVIAPAMVIDGGTWDEEIEKWTDGWDPITVVPYTSINARGPGPRGGQVPLMKLRPEFKGHWDALIIDEAHYIKGRDTYWTWAVLEMAKGTELVIPMTGTPIPNWPHEIFTILQLIFREEAGRGQRFGSFWRWAGEWFDTSPTRFSNGNPTVGEMLDCTVRCLRRPPYDPCDHYKRFAAANFGQHYRRMLRDDCLDLPPITEQTIEVPMTTAQRRVYRELTHDFAAKVSGDSVLAWTQGAKNKMLDLCTVSPWFLNPVGKPRGGKLEMLRHDISSRSRPTFVLAHHREVVEASVRVAMDAGASADYVHGGRSRAGNKEAVQRFKAGKVDVLVGSLEKVAEGLTLNQADMAIYVEKSYKPSRNIQARDRIYRIGQERPVTIKDYVTPDSVDSRKRELLATKTDRQMRVLTAAEFMALL